MKRKPLTRRDFLKLAGLGTAAMVPTALGVSVYRTALGESPLERSPYVANIHTANLDGSAPILVIVDKDSSNPFGVYFSEILRAEGLNCFHLTDLSSLQPASLEKYETAILGETSLNDSQAEMLEAYVARGGRLVGMKPDGRLGAVFGLERSEGSLSEGYLKTESGHPVSKGINPATLQFHGSADLTNLAGAQAIAWLYPDRETASEHPAIAINNFREGLAVYFAFDLAKSIAYMRQGNPERANQDIDGLNGVRTVDMFVDWIDLERIEIPQADEQQRLFVNILVHMSRRPLPRLWYFPEDKKSMLIATGDSHMNPANFIEDVLTRVEARSGHMTVYYTPQIVSDIGRAARWSRFWMTDHVPVLSDILGEEFGSPTPFMVEAWRARGHEITLHPYVDDELEGGWLEYWKEFSGRGYAPLSQTVRTHRILWTGWMETARVQASFGMRMNFDYYHVGPSLQKKNGKWANGHLTGSGRPMKFIDEQGRIIDLYQQLTQIADEHLIPMDVPGWGGWPKLSPQEAVEVSKYLLDRSVKNGDYCAIGGQFHVDPFQLGGDPAEKGGIFLEGTLDYARELGVPIWSAQEWLYFSDLRHDSNFTEMVWDASASSLILRLTQDAALRLAQDEALSLLPFDEPESTLTVLLPMRHGDKTLSASSVDDVSTPFTSRLVLGNVEYAPVTLSAKEHTIRLTYS
jgi:hypothetical protein